MPLDKLPSSSLNDHAEDDSSLHARLRRLEQLLHSLEPVGSRPGTNASATTHALIFSRLEPMAAEVERRIESDDWDALDGLSVRLLLDELAAAVRTCRSVAVDSSRRLREVQSGLKEAERVLVREMDRESADRSSGESAN